MERSSHRGWFLSRPSAASCWKGKTRRRKWWKLQWRHKSVTASRITINTIVCSIALYSYVIWALGRLVSPTVRRSVQWLVWANNKNIDPHYFPFGRRNHRWPVCSPHKGTTIKSVLWHVVYSIAYSGANQRKHQSSASLAFCAGNLPVTGEFPTQRASNAGNISIWWRHHDFVWDPLWLVDSPHKVPIMRKAFSRHDLSWITDSIIDFDCVRIKITKSKICMYWT